jgi:hypothetical protein
VPTTDTYQILAFGAQGGNAAGEGLAAAGGLGAENGGDFTLTAGETLQLAVGGAGGNGFAGGGGGGSFVVGPGNTPLVIAGGGGGGGIFFEGRFPFPGGGRLTGLDGGPIFNGIPTGGTGGNGGPASGLVAGGGGGGGFFSAGGSNGGIGGAAFPDLTGGISGGGFGGGGGAAIGAGGGGGYSGGAGGFGAAGGGGPGGGGGSFDAGADQILVADFRTGNGEVIITELAAGGAPSGVPEPASIALLAGALASLAALRRRFPSRLSR